MFVTKLVCASLAALGLAVVGSVVIAGDKDDEYTIVIKKVEVKTTKANGESWDINDGKPDLCVRIRNVSDKDSKAFDSKQKSDAFSAEFNEPTTIKFRAGQTLEFQVLDIDVAANDNIGKIQKIMNIESLKSGKYRLENVEQVIYLELEVKKL